MIAVDNVFAAFVHQESAMPATPAKLSCEQCRQRKTKCDKGNPCTACRHAGISCTAVQRARLPRGRAVKSQKKNDKLETRLEQLERLIKQLESQVKPDEAISPAFSDTVRPPLDQLESFVARDFWVELSQEVAGLRDTLEESSDDDDEDGDGPTPEAIGHGPFWGSPSDALLTGRSVSTQHALEVPSDRMRATLLELYKERVDVLFKVVHWPSVLGAIEGQYAPDILPGSISFSVRALEFAIYFLAVCSVDDRECKVLLHAERLPLLHQYRLGAEIYTSRAKLLYNPDMTVLQAFVIYLLGLRSCKESALSWTLVASAVRVASALRLPLTESEGRSALEIEVCKRVWFGIGVLDSQTAFDRGFPPMTGLETFASQPKIIDDSQLLRRSAEQTTWDPFTDMSFMYVLQEATICLRKLVAPPKPTVGGEEDPWADWKSKIRTIDAFEESMRQHRIHISASTKAIARFTEFSTEHISLNFHLLLRRPPYRRKNSPVPPWDDFSLLEATTNAMERIMRKSNDATFAPFVWFSRSWVEWNALAVLLAELCGPRDDALAARAYSIAQLVYNQYRTEMAGPDSQMLWRPITRLMRRVRKIRGRESISEQSSSGPDFAVSPPRSNVEGAQQPMDLRTHTPAAAVDIQMADLALQPAPTALTDTVAQNVPLAPWLDEIDNWQANVDASMQPGGDMAWLNWDNFLGDMYSGGGVSMDTFNPGASNQ